MFSLCMFNHNRLLHGSSQLVLRLSVPICKLEKLLPFLLGCCGNQS